MRAPLALCCLLLAGQGWAGEAAWVATYRESGAGRAACEFTLVRSETRAEYRGCGHPVRIYRQLSDGVEMIELDPRQSQAVRYSPGDLRAVDREPDWQQASGIVPQPVMASLGTGKPVQLFGQPALRYRHASTNGQPVQLDWLIDAALPARYRVGPTRSSREIMLRDLQRVDEARAFTSTDGLREVDAADHGD